MAAALHVLRETNLLNIPATLRALADSIEAGKYGEVHGAVLVWDADQLEISYMGAGEAAPNAHLLLHAGMMKMIHAVVCLK